VPNTLKIDPTRTGLIRRKFLADINRRLTKLIQEIHKLFVEEDAFGLAERKPLVVMAAYQQYAFTTDARKLQAFHQWLKEQVDAGILIVSGSGVPGQPWTYDYVESAYKKGVDRAYLDTNKAALAKSPAFYAGSRAEFLRTAFMQPIAMSNLELLSTRTFEQLKGFTNVMSQQLSRQLSIGFAQGWGPLKVAREMQKTIGGLSKSRARMIARTEIIHAHAEGQLDSFTLLGVDELGVMPEWSTAGDDLVCARCQAMEGQTFRVDEARGLIPLHPNCLSRDTEVYTENGFVKIGEVERGGKCLSLNPKTFTLDYVPVVATIAEKNKKMLHFKSCNFDLLVTPEHNMFAKRRARPWTNKREWEFIRAKNVINETTFYRSSEWRGASDSSVWVGGDEIPSDLFCEFMGWWLSEGSFGRRKIIINQDRKANPDKYERICEITENLNRVGPLWKGKEKVYFENYNLREYLSVFGKSHQKYIPHEVKRLEPTHLRIFLDAYAAGDGHRRRARLSKFKGGGVFREEIVYTTSSKRMADDLGELLIKVGRRPSYSVKKTKGKVVDFSNGSYEINHDIIVVRECYGKTSTVNPKTGIKVKEVQYDDYAYCVQLSKWHTLLARRNGKVAWTGNCRCAWTPSEQKK